MYSQIRLHFCPFSTKASRWSWRHPEHVIAGRIWVLEGGGGIFVGDRVEGIVVPSTELGRIAWSRVSLLLSYNTPVSER